MTQYPSVKCNVNGCGMDLTLPHSDIGTMSAAMNKKVRMSNDMLQRASCKVYHAARRRGENIAARNTAFYCGH